jgi:putative colanic acid biosysnthesis UDP-glucose lipid carrier transferase
MSEQYSSDSLRPRRKRLLQNHDTLAQWIQHILNLGVVSATLCIFAYWRDGEVGAQYRTMLAFALLLMTITYHLMGVFRRFDRLEGAIKHLARAWGIVIIILAWTAFLTKTSEDYSRQVVVYWVLAAFVGQAALLTMTYGWYTLYRRKYQERIPALIIGNGQLANHLAHSIKNNIWLSDTIVGVVRHHQEPMAWTSKTIPLLGTEENLLDIINTHNVRRIYVALPLEQTYAVRDINNLLRDINLDIVWAPDIFEFQLLNHSVREVAGIPLINLNETPLMAGGPAFIKLIMDKSISAVLIVLLSPVLAAVALAVKLSSPGPIIFKQQRDGWDGKKFYVYKFRSMYVHEEKQIVEQAKKNDSRITPVGGFIRRTSLDELPQLFNALEGSMSLVGPRPHAVSHNVFYSDKVKDYLARHRIKPGITGLAQIAGFRGETETLESMERRVELDLKYICNWSPMLDLKILFLTPIRLISKKGNAY